MLLGLSALVALGGGAGGRSDGGLRIGVLAAQQARVRLPAATPIHAEPGGNQLGTLPAGFQVTPGRTSGTWREVPVEGWIWTASTGAPSRPGFDLAVTADAGENVRTAPDGDVVFKAVKGTQFDRVARRGGWTQVRRTVWVPAAALGGGRADGQTGAGAENKPSAPAAPVPQAAPAQAIPTPPPPSDTLSRVVVRKGTTVAAGPGGSPLVSLQADVPGQITARTGDWVRIRAEGWVRKEDVRPAADSAGVTLEQLRAAPEKYVGPPVSWRLQFLAVKVADELRPELPPGEPYVLSRGPLPEAGFVYVAVTKEQAERFRSMSPLDEFTANGTIRAAKTRYLPTPVIELGRTP